MIVIINFISIIIAMITGWWCRSQDGWVAARRVYTGVDTTASRLAFLCPCYGGPRAEGRQSLWRRYHVGLQAACGKQVAIPGVAGGKRRRRGG